MPDHFLYVSVSGFDIFSLMLVIGALACQLWVIPAEGADGVHERLWRVLAVALGALTLSSLALLIDRTLEMSREPLAAIGPILGLVVRKTPFGHFWLLRMTCVVLLVLGWMAGRRGAGAIGRLWAMFALAAVIAFTRSATGHPADGGQFTFPEWLDWAHLIASSVWAGSVFVAVAALWPSSQTMERLAHPVVGAFASRLSRASGIALGIVLVTGFVSAWHYVVQWHNLWGTDYGRVLLVKLLLISVAMILGATNRYLHVPRILRWAGSSVIQPLSPLSRAVATERAEVSDVLRPLAGTIAVEAAFLFGTVIVAAVLLHTASPSDMAAMAGMSAPPR
ncbi:MAG: copper resistance D family protein [Acidiferrobacteraceae bacterium]